MFGRALAHYSCLPLISLLQNLVNDVTHVLKGRTMGIENVIFVTSTIVYEADQIESFILQVYLYVIKYNTNVTQFCNKTLMCDQRSVMPHIHVLRNSGKKHIDDVPEQPQTQIIVYLGH